MNIDENAAPVKMIVIDGIVMGPTHCAYDGCTSELANAHGGVFCEFHNLQYEEKCRMCGCTSIKKSGTQACSEHQDEWKKNAYNRSRQSLAGVKRELFTLPHLFLLDSYWTPGLLVDFTRTPANFILADHHTNLASQSYWSPSKFLLESLGIVDS